MAPRRSTRIEITARLLAGRRRKSSRLGVVLAVVALLVQSAGLGLHVRAPIGLANGIGKFSFAFDAHALCLASNDAAPVPAAPADKAPKADHDFAAAASGTELPARFSHPLRSSSPSPSLRLPSLSRRRRRTSQLASPAPFAPVPLRQELNARAA